jgi:hypothetical protein
MRNIGEHPLIPALLKIRVGGYIPLPVLIARAAGRTRPNPCGRRITIPLRVFEGHALKVSVPSPVRTVDAVPLRRTPPFVPGPVDGQIPAQV